ncbi:MAG: hypothetical protein Q8P81_03340 [Nanoarchaeota archaeon]|nr:hypothetical protein [Nanoarchaeota archaeon]
MTISSYIDIVPLQGKIKKILTDSYVSFRILEYSVKENDASTKVSFKLEDSLGNTYQVEDYKSDKGFVDALFNGVVSVLEKERRTLSQLMFFDLVVTPIKTSYDEEEYATLEKNAVSKLVIVNGRSLSERFVFSSESFSLTKSAVDVVVKAIEFFVNAEHAYRFLLISYKEAKKRNRNDLVEKYKNEMSEMVKVCCYSEVAISLKGKECNA